MAKEDIKGYRFRLHPWYKSNLNIILNEAIPNQWDSVGIMFGIEGAGKSTLATQTALYLDHGFDLNRTVFAPGDFTDAVDDEPEKSSILWDEAITGANIRNFAEEMNRSIVSKMTQIRDKRMKFLLCFPHLNLLEKYFISRATFGVYVHAHDFNDRGYARFYNQPQLEYLYNLMKTRYSNNPMQAIRESNHAFKFKFSKTLCLPEVEYKRKKNKARLTNESKEIPNKRLIQELLRRQVDRKTIMDLVRKDDGKKFTQQYISRIAIDMGL